ncbi:hypothetical protein TWF569_008034 [Orbilia oligospora]|nr:hypothetical protein TWF569_008034 [Orbilia oligospora]
MDMSPPRGRIAAMAMFDEEHEPRGPQPSADHNVYYLGNIQSHNVVIAGLHKAGNSSAATAVAQMMITFPNLKFGLLVGIGGGVPVKTDNGRIRLGDVVVSKPTGEHSGAVQYDHGKAEMGRFRSTEEKLNGKDAPRDVTALHLAAYFGLRETITALLKMGNDPDSRDTAGRTPLSVAIGAGQEAVVKLLLENGAKNNFRYEELDTDIKGHRSMVADVIRQFYRLGNKVASIPESRDCKQTPLLHAIELGNGPIVRLLLEHGADKNIRDYIYGTPLIRATEKKHEERVRILLENGVDLEIKDVNGRTPLLQAVIAQHQAIVELLLKHKADTEFKFKGYTAIFWAMNFGNETLVKLLIENNADLEAREKKFSYTPLILATCFGNVGMVRVLLSQGAAIGAKDDTGNTSLWLAANLGHEEMAGLLLSQGAEINSAEQMGFSPLVVAAFRGPGTNNPFAWLLPHLLLLSSSHHTQSLINQPTSSSHHSTDKMRAKWRKKRVRRLKRKRRKTRARSK